MCIISISIRIFLSKLKYKSKCLQCNGNTAFAYLYGYVFGLIFTHCSVCVRVCEKKVTCVLGWVTVSKLIYSETAMY